MTKAILTLLALITPATAQQSISLHAKLSINKKDNTTELLSDATKLQEFAKSNNIQPSLNMFLSNLMEQLVKLNNAQTTVQKEIKKEKAVSFTVGKYKLKEMKKLRAKDAKKHKMQQHTVEDFEKKYGKKLEFSKPFLVKDGAKLFKDFDAAREKFTAEQFQTNEYLERNTLLDYWPPDVPRQQIVGNTIQFADPVRLPFSRYLTMCYLGTPAAPKIPGQATEHCEQTMGATKMVEHPEELDVFETKLPKSGTPLVDNVFYDWEKTSSDFFKSSNETENEMKKILGKREGEAFIKQHASGNFRYFVFGPSGSGEKLKAENGLPFFDVLIQGYRRWLLVTEDEVQKVANKAKEALEFQQTSAYMFFEEKLPELKEEFGLKNYIEVNQEPGDVIFVPSGWFRVSLSLADSISYYEQMLYQPRVVEDIVRNTVWNPQMRQFNLAFCYKPDEVVEQLKRQELKTDKLDPKSYEWIESQMKQVENNQFLSPLMNVLTTCSKILKNKGKIGKLISIEKTKCSADVWTACRGMLVEKLAKMKKKVELNWLPEKITSSDDSDEL